ncbi:uroporphyrinogen-III synthase [Brevibacterium litoralis]|uniref:uroporphyrinogen-III synthase n=1 Tax=Brevibacterium litoralis TaxID=3138935 RepID=UPI0032EA98A1
MTPSPSFHGFDLSDRPVLLVGTGRSRLPVLARLHRAGARLTVADSVDRLIAVHQDLSLLAAGHGLTPSHAWSFLATALHDLHFVSAARAVSTLPDHALVVCVPRDDAEASFWAEQCARLRVLSIPVWSAEPGVSLVGGGPGPVDLMTLGAQHDLRHADVVFADRLGPRESLDELCPGALVVDVGKDPGYHRIPQDRIEELLVEFGRSGYRVVRLKGGDPYVFGRGAEERRTLLASGVPVTVRPGITSAVSVPAAADVPVTCRGISTSFTVLSGHQVPEPRVLEGLVKVGGTLVLLMAVNNLVPILDGLRAHGLDAEVPAAVVENGWAADQRVFTGTAASIVGIAAQHSVRSPAVVVIGEVVRLRDELLAIATEASARLDPEPPLEPGVDGEVPVRGALDAVAAGTGVIGTALPAGDAPTDGATEAGVGQGASGADPLDSPAVQAAAAGGEEEPAAPLDTVLAGFTIGVTASRRATDQANAFRRRGAQVVSAPTLRITPTEGDADLLDETRSVIDGPPDLLLVTTGHGLNGWFEAAEAAGLGDDLRAALGSTTILVRGAKARGAVRAQGFSDAGISADDSTTSLVDVALAHGVAGRRVAVQQHGVIDHGQMARMVEAGADLVTIRPYRWAPPEDPKAVESLVAAVIRHHVDVLTFTSAPSAEALFEAARAEGTYDLLVEAMRTEVTCAAVGPVTAAPLVAAGVEPLIPPRHRLGSLIRVVVDHLNDHAIDRAETPAGTVALRGVDLHVTPMDGARDGDGTGRDGRVGDGSVGDGEPNVITLPPHLADLLRIVIQAQGDVVSRDTLRRALPAAPSDHAIDMAVSRLRKLLGDLQVVVTVPKRGFRLAR